MATGLGQISRMQAPRQERPDWRAGLAMPETKAPPEEASDGDSRP